MEKKTKTLNYTQKNTDDISNLVTKVIGTIRTSVGVSTYSAVRDLLTQLMHYCAKRGHNFETLVERATEVYEEETRKN